jgi:drug/metabolite transporter (DMT)-like permease
MFRKNKYYPLLELNLSFILMSTSGLFGKIIPLNPSVTILIRCLIAGFMLLGYLRLRGGLNISWKRDRWFFLISSVLLAIHWVSYFQAIKMAGVALAMLSLFSYPIITSILEPLFFKTKHSWFEILFSLIVLGGLALIVPEFSFGNRAVQGVLLGLVSALLYAIRNIMNRQHITIYSGTTIMCYQLLISAAILLPALWIYPPEISVSTWSNLVLLSLVTTAIAHTLFVQSLSNFTASTVSILSCLTPAYGILWAVWLTDEKLDEGTIWGGLIILLATFAQSVRHIQKHPHVAGNIR